MPATDKAMRSGHHPRGGHRALPGWVGLSLLMVAIWAMAGHGHGYFWPMWIIVPSALGSIGSCGHGHRVRHDHHRISA